MYPEKQSMNMEISGSEYDGFKINREGLIKTVQCNICWNLLSPPIRQCRSGHCICSHCFKVITKCGLCRQRFSEVRCIAVEGILEHISIRCTYKDEGCSVMLSARDRKMHEDTCAFRSVECSLEGGLRKCKRIPIDLKTYKQHLLNVHQVPCLNDGTCNDAFRIQFYDNDILEGDNGLWPLVYFSFENHVFLIRNSIVQGTFMSWITIAGTEDEAKRFKVTITLESSCDHQEDKVWSNVPVLTPHCQKITHLKCPDQFASEEITELKKYCDGNLTNPINSRVYNFSWCVLYECSRVEKLK